MVSKGIKCPKSQCGKPMKVSGDIAYCPYCGNIFWIVRACGDCTARTEAHSLVNQNIAENLKDYWKHQASYSEGV